MDQPNRTADDFRHWPGTKALSDVSRQLDGITYLMCPILGESLNEQYDATGRRAEHPLREADPIATREESRP
jgi:hypothetical protein